MNTERCIVALDVGTTKILVLVGKPVQNDQVEIVGMGLSASVGLRKGVVVDINKTITSLKKALDQAREIADMPIGAAFVGIAGDHISSINTRGLINIRPWGGEITPAHQRRVIKQALKFKIAQGNKIIHVLPREYILDGVDGVLDPIGMSARKMEVRTHIVMGAISSIHNLVHCVQEAGVTVEDIILEPLASAEAVLKADEKELGTALVDIGGGTTDLAVFIEGGICHTKVLPFGGNHVTRDVAVGLRVSLKEAEEIKCRHGVATVRIADPMTVFNVRDLHTGKKKKILKSNLAGVIEPRMKEIFKMVKEEIIRSGMLKLLAGGVVLTGGSSQLAGVERLGSEMLELPVRVGTPTRIIGPSNIIKNSVYATGAGILLYARKHKALMEAVPQKQVSLVEVADRVRKWFTETVTNKIPDKFKPQV